jgi:predicted dehydrogenase
LRFLPSLYALLSVLHTKSIGNIISVKASLGGRTVVLEEDYGHPGVGALMALGSYPIFLSLLLLGEPLSVQATGRLSPDGRDDCCTSLVTFEGGRYASLECSWIKGARDEALITGDKGSITLHDRWHRDPGDLSIALEGKVILRRHNAWEGRGQQFVVSEVLRCLDSGLTESDLMRLTMSRRIAAVTEEIRTQLSSGSPMASTAAFS